MAFDLHKVDPSGARLGTLHLPHGDVPTPIFMPVGTQGKVKTLHPEDLEALGAQILRVQGLHRALRAHGHEDGGGHIAMRQMQCAQPGAARVNFV